MSKLLNAAKPNVGKSWPNSFPGHVELSGYEDFQANFSQNGQRFLNDNIQRT